ncbi:MAG: hypothetical protein FJW14_17190 [Acidimicrobiia bacterium]|nr:hypothetical protein [Acidimicrobiia bacterium]
MLLLQDKPFVVEIIRQPEVTRDVSVDAVLGMFALAGIAMLFAAIGGLIVGGIFVYIRRLQDSSAANADTPATSHVRLQI